MLPILCLLVASNAVVAVVREGDPPVLDPKRYRSPSGRYELFVDPTERSGAGVGHYALTCDGQPVWSRDEPFTLWEAVVGDEGSIGGYAYTHGYRDYRTEGRFLVVHSLWASDSLRVLQEQKRVRNFYEGAPWPVGVGVVLDPEETTLIVRTTKREFGRGEEWRLFDTVECSFARTMEPALTNWVGTNSLDAALHVPETPLLLVSWTGGRGQLRHGLMDLGGRLVAEVDPGFDARIPGSFDDIFRWERSARASRVGSTPRSFELLSASEQVRVRFEVSATGLLPGAGWELRELERRPEPVSTAIPEPPTPAQVALERLAEVRLGASLPPADALTSIRELAVGAEGTIAVFDGDANVVHLFRPDGARLRRIECAGLGLDRPSLTRPVVLPNGELWLRGSGGPWVAFDALGERVAPPTVATSAYGTACAPRQDGRVWVRPMYGPHVELQSRSGEVALRVTRRPDGRWLRNPTALTAGPEGELCVLDGGGYFDELVPVLCLYANDGAPLRVLPAPIDGLAHFAFTHRWVVGVQYPGWLVLIDAGTGATQRADLRRATDTERSYWEAFASPDGREAWVIELYSRTLQRFRLPE